jgi:hypothetical protein
MSVVISASRRTDLAASFPDVLACALSEEKARVLGPAGRSYEVDLRPENVHTLVLWSKDYTNLLADRSGLRGLAAKYEQGYFHFTVTGLGGTSLERGVLRPDEAMAQLPGLVAVAGSPARVSVRFDPIVFWREEGRLVSNLPFFDRLAPRLADAGITDVRVSFAQWYGKAKRRAKRRGFDFLDPEEREKRARAADLAGPRLRAFLMHRRHEAPGAPSAPRACIDKKGPDPAAGMRLYRIKGHRELHAGLPPFLRLLLCQCRLAFDKSPLTPLFQRGELQACVLSTVQNHICSPHRGKFRTMPASPIGGCAGQYRCSCRFVTPEITLRRREALDLPPFL